MSKNSSSLVGIRERVESLTFPCGNGRVAISINVDVSEHIVLIIFVRVRSNLIATDRVHGRSHDGISCDIRGDRDRRSDPLDGCKRTLYGTRDQTKSCKDLYTQR